MKRRGKRRTSADKVYIKDWMTFKPYDVHTSYDLHYLKIANDIYEGILVVKNKKVFAFDIPAPKMLACIIASYYEDYVSEIGIWKAFTSYNEELYGYYLPFYESEEYDPDYINPEDIAYLIWHFCCKWENTFYAPDFPIFQMLGNVLYEYLEPLLDKAQVTGAYNDFFEIKASNDFFDVKERLKWFVESSYLFGAEFRFKIKERIEEALQPDSEDLKTMDPEKLVYAILEEYVYRHRSSFSALNAPEFFARIARCSESVRQDIAALTKRHVGSFLYVGEEEEEVIFASLQTGREYKVIKNSFQDIRQVKNRKDSIALFSLVQWQGKWWMTGTAAFLPKSESVIKSIRKEPLPSPHIRTAEQMQSARDAIEEQYQVFITHFGGPLATFPTRRAANEGMREYYRVHREKMLAKKPEHKDTAPPPLEGNFVGDIPEAGGVGVFFNQGEGIVIITWILDAIRCLEQKGPLTQEESGDLFEIMTQYHPSLVKYLLDKYPTRNIKLPIKQSNVNLVKYIWFVNRFEHPDDFGEVFPNITMVDRAQWEE